ncbi:hypothetical protein ANCCEY_03188 [Ancylostoma ceylanicum]|uniref:Uncharacterized protein n=2 Tax=Ancylostoma ceylanicum TaxID=53326 RepID=A0A016VY55_9BILA|nr:hypothetical protein ANCCEY_03188 [Ancylostoma ceylanicum]EYC32509.1 hypothetical protein Y032_0003g1621 [Ancylostoma ceylanicum]
MENQLEDLLLIPGQSASTPKIAQTWITGIAHNMPKNLYHTDDHFLEFFQRNKDIIDKSFFFIMGDHGPLAANIGKTRLGRYETLNPFLMVIIPAVYRNTSIFAELQKKSHQLMTNFDLHATLMDILKLQPAANFSDTGYRNMTPLSKGSSLLREWKGPRNCRTLPIPSHHCICQYNKTEVKQRELKMDLGQYFAKQLNLHLKRKNLDGKCQMQYYNQSSLITKIQDGVSTLYDVAVYLSPSGGLFSAFIRQSEHGLKMSSDFSRLDAFGRQGYCLAESPNQQLCHCIGATTP